MPSRVILQPKRAKPFFGRHPWVFAGAIASVEGSPADGDEVDLVTHTGQFVARGLFNSKSKIRVRLYSWQPEQPLDESFFRERLSQALRLRQTLGLMSPEGAYRLVNSEGDGLSGLVVDRYGPWLVMQFTSLGMASQRGMLAGLLADLCKPEGIYLRTERGVGSLEGLDLQDGPLRGALPPSPVLIEEDGLRLEVNLTEGQKTGFYLDQRDNRRVVGKLAFGRRVLDAFCYSGGFALQAARGGAKEVIGVDGSDVALTLARQNAERNGLGQVQYLKADVFRDLEERANRQEQFGLIVLDPPKFARKRNAIDEALNGYRRLQSLALRLLEPEGILVSCSCSGLIDLGMLEELLAQVSADGKRFVQLLERRGPALDHPVAVSCLESHYLKCLIARVV